MKPEWTFASIVSIALLLIVSALLWLTFKPPDKALYDIWIKTYPKHSNLTLEEWDRLRKAHMLPGQGAKRDGGPVVIPVVVPR